MIDLLDLVNGHVASLHSGVGLVHGKENVNLEDCGGRGGNRAVASSWTILAPAQTRPSNVDTDATGVELATAPPHPASQRRRTRLLRCPRLTPQTCRDFASVVSDFLKALNVEVSLELLSIDIRLDATWNFMALALLTCGQKQVSHPQQHVL